MNAAPATLTDLVRAVAARVEADLSALWAMQTRAGDVRAVQVHVGDLPPKSGNDAARYPWAVVRLRDHTDSEEAGTPTASASVEIEIGTYSDDAEGVIDVYNLIQTLRVSLIESPILAGTAFEHVGPMTSAIPDLQFHPEWLGAVNTIWRIPRPARALVEV